MTHLKKRTRFWVLIGLFIFVVIAAVIFVLLNTEFFKSSASTTTPGIVSASGVIKQFNPEGTVSRAELCDAAYRIKAVNRPNAVTQTFSDVSPSYWAYNQIDWCNRYGIIKGYSDNTFRPDEVSTRATVAVIAKRAFIDLGIGPTPRPVASSSYTDVPVTYWAYREIQLVSAAGYIKGYGDGTFKPDANATRATLAVVLSRATGQSYDNPAPSFSDVVKTYWAYKEIEGITRLNYMDFTIPGSAILSLSPSTGRFATEGNFDANILINTDGKYVDGVDVMNLNYPVGVLDVVDVKKSNAFPNIAVSSKTGGKITFISTIQAGTAGFKGVGIIATVTFKVISPAKASVWFSYTPGSTTDCNVSEHGTGKDILAAVVNASYDLIAWSDKVSLYISPTSGNYAIGETFDVAIKVNPANHGIVGIDVADFHYDPAALDVVSITPGQYYSKMIPNPPVADNGTIKFSALYSTYPSGWGFIVATVKFKVKNQTLPSPPTYKTTLLSFDFTPGVTTDCNVSITGSPGVDSLQTVVQGYFGLLKSK